MINMTPLPPIKYHVTLDADIFHVAEKQALKNCAMRKFGRMMWNIFSIIVFPIGLARLIAMFARFMTRSLVLPARWMFNPKKPKMKELDTQRELCLMDPKNHAEQVTIKTADGAILDNLIMRSPSQLNVPQHEQKWVVFFIGNGGCYEMMLDEMQLLTTRGVNTFIGNPRGVFRSLGKATKSKHLIMDGEARIQYLKHLGIDTKNMLLHGHSLGGAVATAVAVNHQEKGHEVNLCNDRSFASVQAFVKVWAGKYVGPVLNNLVINGRWEFNSVVNYKKINGKKFIIHSKQDMVIDYTASLCKYLEDEDYRFGTEQSPKSLKQEAIDSEPVETVLKIVVAEHDESILQTISKDLPSFAHCFPIFGYTSAIENILKNIDLERRPQVAAAFEPLRCRAAVLSVDYCDQVRRVL